MLLLTAIHCSGVLAAASWLHIPHDSANGIAVAPLAGGGTEIVTVSGGLTKVMRTRDDGLSWEVVVGAGLESTAPADVVYHPGLSPPRFFIGTNAGVWTYDPVSGAVAAASTGLDADDRYVIDMAAPGPGSDGPVLLVSGDGDVYGWEEAAQRWRLLYSSGLETRTATVALPAHYDSSAPNGRQRTLAAAVNGVLALSTDGGATWSVHPQFATPAVTLIQWRIFSLAFSEDYQNDGIMLVGRARQDPRFGGFFELGEIWRSADAAVSFTKVKDLEAGVETLCATPPDAAGVRHFFACTPFYYSRPTGTLRSDDGGLTWDDFGNSQDIATEEGSGPGGAEVHGWLKYKQGCAISPYYGQDSKVWNARLEGVFDSADDGVHWRQMGVRSDREARDVDLAADAFGSVLAFGAGYGSAVVVSDLTRGLSGNLALGCPMPYMKEVEVSPRYAQDGTVAAGGVEGLLFWFNPTQPPNNPFLASGWFLPPLIDMATSQPLDGYVRSLEMSPHFDNSAGSGGDQAIYLCAWEQPPYRTRDGGQTVERLDQVNGGGTVNFMEFLTIAPTYDDATAAGRTDVYAAKGTSGWVYRLDDTEWSLVHRFSNLIVGMQVDPDFSRPGNPRIFVALRQAPYIVALYDHPTGAVTQNLTFGLDASLLMQDLAVPPDFATRQTLYAATWGRGVYKLDLNATPLQWLPLGQNYPNWYVQGMGVSPNFAGDQTLVLATQYGLLSLADRPGASWTAVTNDSWRDNEHPDLTPYAPNDPANPHPDRPWEWEELRPVQTDFRLEFAGRYASITEHNGSYYTCSGYARELVLHTVSGPGAGAVRITAEDYFTGAQLGLVNQNLHGLTNQNNNFDVRLTLPALSAVRVKVECLLQPGEQFVFDGLSFIR